MESTSKKPRTEMIEGIPLSVREGTSEEVVNEIIEVLKSTRFNKISFPLTSYRRIYDDTTSADDNRVVAVGYIKKFDATNKTFTVIMFNNNADVLTKKYKKEDLMIEAVFTQFKEKLGIITKLVIAPMTAE